MLKKYSGIEQNIIIIILSLFLGQIYFSPFSNNFRFSFSVVFISIVFLFIDEINIIFISILIGFSIMIFRSIIVIDKDSNIFLTIFNNSPVFIFYLSFGILFFINKVKEKTKTLIILFGYLWFCDSVSNMIELALKIKKINTTVEGAVYLIIILGALRSLFTISLYKLFTYIFDSYKKKLKDERYKKLLLFFSNIKTELFFLNKSMADIEEAMKYSYEIYESFETGKQKENALYVARKIHEVKKDYFRIKSNMEKALQNSSSNDYYDKEEEIALNISEIFSILEINTKKVIENSNKNIDISFKFNEDTMIYNYYEIISILNNLIVNAIEAYINYETHSKIVISYKVNKEKSKFIVFDNCSGIDKDQIEYIFDEGFTTKFNPVTGNMSTGIGLSHAKYLVEEFYKGTISVISEGRDTFFNIEINTESLKQDVKK